MLRVVTGSCCQKTLFSYVVKFILYSRILLKDVNELYYLVECNELYYLVEYISIMVMQTRFLCVWLI